jgi:hypothetical protein
MVLEQYEREAVGQFRDCRTRELHAENVFVHRRAVEAHDFAGVGGFVVLRTRDGGNGY